MKKKLIIPALLILCFALGGVAGATLNFVVSDGKTLSISFQRPEDGTWADVDCVIVNKYYKDTGEACGRHNCGQDPIVRNWLELPDQVRNQMTLKQALQWLADKSVEIGINEANTNPWE